jgi:hypothetical protein
VWGRRRRSRLSAIHPALYLFAMSVAAIGAVVTERIAA